MKVDVYGISLDDVKALAKFVKTEKLGFHQLSDPDGSAASKYGVLGRRGYAKRRTFVIDPKGVLRHIEMKVDVRAASDQLVAIIQKLQA